MKTHLLQFLRRGLLSCWGGPVILAVIYLFAGTADIPAVRAAIEILTITVLAFVAGGITQVYQIERLPLMAAVLIHGLVLYLDYLIIYLINGWLAQGTMPLVIFTVCFAAGYALIWLGIYCTIRKKTGQLNRALCKKAEG